MELSAYYVYAYVDEEGDIVYIGKGCKGRAWHCGYMKGDTEERQRWKEEEMLNGRLPNDWVIILDRNLTHSKALEVEKVWIEREQPILNRLHTTDYVSPSRKWTEEHTVVARELREQGYSYSAIATELGVTTMTAWRNMNER